jgi:choline monooxygenase
VVARTRDGRLAAFSNVCRHRASIFVPGQGSGPSLRCPYRNWTYGLDGRLLSQPEFEGVQDWDESQGCLPQYRVEAWGPFVFVKQHPAAPGLLEVLGAIPGEVAEIGCWIEQLRFAARRVYVINCGDGGRALFYWLFPSFMLNIYPNNLSSNIVLALGHNKTLTIFEWFAYGDQPAMEPEAIAFSDEIQREDIQICESVPERTAVEIVPPGAIFREAGKWCSSFPPAARGVSKYCVNSFP